MNLASMADCPTSELWLRLLDGNLSPTERQELESHLKGCHSCSLLLAVTSERSFADSIDGSGSIHFGSPAGSDPIPGSAVAPAPGARAGGERPIMPPPIAGLTDFRLVKRGGMGVVFAAREVNLDRPVAVKVLAAAGSFAPSTRTRAIRESLLMAQLRHPNVVQVYRSGVAEDLPYLVMEWVEGGTLRDRSRTQPFTPREAARTVHLLARAVAEAHARNIIHRDLKPENVMVMPSAGDDLGFIPKLTDFGLARQSDGQGLTEPGVICGTPGYMAPEQTGLARSVGPVGPATDIHGLGAILYAILAGKAPHAGATSWDKLVHAARGIYEPLANRRRDLPLDLVTIVDKCLRVDMTRRYRSATELADDLARFLDGRPILARPISPPERLAKWARRRPTLATLGTLLIVALVVGTAGIAHHVGSIRRALDELAREQGRTARALAAATEARDQARLALASVAEARDQARLALAALSDDVVKRLLARGKALNDADRRFLAEIRGYYLRWPLEPDAEAALKLRGQGLAQLGEIFEQIHQYDESQSCREAAIAAYDEALRRGYDAPEIVDARIKTMVLLHQVLGKSGQPVAAEAVSRRLIATHQPLAAGSVNHRRNLGLDYIRLGNDFSNQHREADADAAFRTGMAGLELLQREHPAHFDVCKAGLRAYYIAADCSRQVDRKEGLYRKLLGATEAALVAFPGNPEILRYRLIALADLVTLLATDRPTEALPFLRWRSEVARDLVARQPENKMYRGDLIAGAAQTYHLYKRLGRSVEAEPGLIQAVAMASQLVEVEPAVFEHAAALVEVLEAYALLCAETDHPFRAIDQLDRIAATLSPWIKLVGRSDEVADRLIKSHRQAVGLVTKLGDNAEAARRLTLILELCKPDDRARTHLELAQAWLATGDRSRARESAELALTGATGPAARQLLDSLETVPGVPH